MFIQVKFVINGLPGLSISVCAPIELDRGVVMSPSIIPSIEMLYQVKGSKIINARDSIKLEKLQSIVLF